MHPSVCLSVCGPEMRNESELVRISSESESPSNGFESSGATYATLGLEREETVLLIFLIGLLRAIFRRILLRITDEVVFDTFLTINSFGFYVRKFVPNFVKVLSTCSVITALQTNKRTATNR